MSRKILQLGNGMLREVSRKVAHPSAVEVNELAGDLYETLKENPGWGISAVQVGNPVKMFLMASPKATVEPLPFVGERIQLNDYSKTLRFTAIVNPRIIKVSEGLETDHESCLSVPGVTALVPRHTWIHAEFRTLDNKFHSIPLHGHPARVFQHEYDHLEGIMFLDRVLDTCDIMMESELSRIIERQELEDQRLYSDGEETKVSELDKTFEMYHS